MIGLPIFAFVKKMEQISRDVKDGLRLSSEKEVQSLDDRGKDYASFLDEEQKKEIHIQKNSKKGQK